MVSIDTVITKLTAALREAEALAVPSVPPTMLAAPPPKTGSYDPGGPSDMVDVNSLPSPIPWTAFVDDKHTIARPAGGKEVKYRKIGLYGNQNHLYRIYSAVVGDAIVPLNVHHGENPQGALDALKTWPVRAGPRGKAISTPYAAVHGHSRIREDGSIADSLHVPMWVSLLLDGRFVYHMRDGSMQIDTQRVTTSGYTNDFTFYNPNRKIMFVCDSARGVLLRVDRTNPTWAISDHATGLGTLTSCRAIGTKVYCANNLDGLIVEIDGETGARRSVAALPDVFWIDYQSDGTLVAMTTNGTVHRVVNGVVGANLVHIDADVYPWVMCDVDRNGTVGPKDAIYALAPYDNGARAVWRVVNGVATVGSGWIDSGEGTMATGPVIRVSDPCGHYPWTVAVHPEDGAFFFQGTANIQPGIVTVMHPGDWPDPYPHSDAFYEQGLEAMRMIGRSGAVPAFACLMGEQGDSFLGCTSDYITSLGPVGAAAFIRKGMIGSVPRTFTDAELAPLLKYLFYNSQQHLVRGAAVVQEVDAWLASTPVPPVEIGLPAWVPTTIGEARMVPMKNTLDSVALVNDAWSGDSAATFCSYSGGVFNPHYGANGAMVIHGGGHGASQDNSVFVADLNTLRFERVGGPTQLADRMDYEHLIQNGGFPDDISNPREVGPHEPGSAHTYDCLCLLSPGESGDALGALIRPVAGAIGAGVSRETGWSHVFTFTDRKWKRWSTNYASAWSPGGSCLHDKVRGRIWPINEQASRMMLDTKTRTWTNFNEPNGTLNSYVDMVQSRHHVLRDIGVITTHDQGELKSRFFWFHAGDGKARNLATFSTGDLPKANWGGGTLVDVPELGKMIFWSRYDPQRYFEIAVPEDPSQPWSWVAKAITGVNMAAVRCNEAVYKRFDYAPQLKSLIWVPGRNVNDFMFGSDVVCLRVR
jgi:hypothetical protein